MDDEKRAWVRRNVIAALCSDDELVELLVLKGGNALDLVYGIGGRTSSDIDYSLETDFPDWLRARGLLEHALKRHFVSAGFVVVDFRANPRPPRDALPMLSGYYVEFKLVARADYDRWQADPSRVSRQSEVVATRNVRRVEIQVSKHEYCGGSDEREIPDLPIPLTVRVYTPAMIVAEKLRALCQQMPEYRGPTRATPRARDVYDIHATISGALVSLGDPLVQGIVREMFRAKNVPLILLASLASQREFHRPDWVSVEESVRGPLVGSYDDHFNSLIREVKQLETLWVEETP